MSPATAAPLDYHYDVADSDVTTPDDGRFFVRWDPTNLAIDHSLQVKVDGHDHEALFAIDGMAQGSLAGIGSDSPVSAKLQIATDALHELAASGGGDRPTGRVPCGKGVFVLTAPDLRSHSLFRHIRTISHGEFELNVLRPDADDLLMRGWLEQLDAYDARVGIAVRAAQDLAAELR